MHWPTAIIDSPVSVTVADADCEVFAWLVALTVTEVTVLRGWTVTLATAGEEALFAVTETVLAPGSTDTEVAVGAV